LASKTFKVTIKKRRSLAGSTPEYMFIEEESQDNKIDNAWVNDKIHGKQNKKNLNKNNEKKERKEEEYFVSFFFFLKGLSSKRTQLESITVNQYKKVEEGLERSRHPKLNVEMQTIS